MCRRRLKWRNFQHRPSRKDDRALDHMFQFANIPWPGIPAQSLHSLRSDALDALLHSLRELRQEILDQQRNVLTPLTQRRHRDGKNIQPVKQITAKLTRRYEFFQITVGGSDNPNVSCDRSSAAQAFELFFLQCAQ